MTTIPKVWCIMAMMLLRVFFLTTTTTAQEYTEYANEYIEDNLYQDYYSRKQEDQVQKQGGGMGKMILGTALGWVVGAKLHTGRSVQKLKKKHHQEQKTLYTQYYNDVYKLQEQNTQLLYAIEELQLNLKQVQEQAQLDALQRDYDEFKQPDLDGDDRISRGEFNSYVETYLKNYPGLEAKDYPKFEDFDHDQDGYVSFTEYAQQMALQVQKAEQEQNRKNNKGTASEKQKVQSLKGLYQETKRSDGFDDLYASLRR